MVRVKFVAEIFGDRKVGLLVTGRTYDLYLRQSIKGALVAFIAKVEGVVQEKFSGAPPQTPFLFAPPIKYPGGATARPVFKLVFRQEDTLALSLLGKGKLGKGTAKCFRL